MVLIDGHAILHRAYHAIPATFTDGAGNPTNAIFGFSSMLLQIIKTLKPEYLVVAFDHPGPTFRHDQFKAYKEGRPQMENNLVVQIPKVKRLLRDIEVPFYEVEGYEGEDILATIIEQVLGRKFKGRCEKMGGLDIDIVTGDRDTLQLVGPCISIVCPRKGLVETKIYDEAAILKEYGLTPDQITDYKGLRGDPSDKIPGVHGIGEKMAIKLLKKFGTLEEIYHHLGEIDRVTAKALAEGAEDAALSKKIATITHEVPLKFDISDALLGKDFPKRLKEAFLDLGFKSLVNRLEGKVVGKKAGVGHSNRGIRSGAVGQLELI